MVTLIVDNGSTLPNPPDEASSVLRVLPNMETRLNGDPKTEAFIAESGFKTTSNLRVVVTDRDGTVSRPVRIYDPEDFVADPSTPNQPLTTQVWSPILNLYTVVRLGNYLYGIDYDLGKVVEMYGIAPYAATGVTYQQPVSRTSKYQARGQELVVVDGVLYGLFAYPDSGFANYDPSVLVRFEINPGLKIEAEAMSNDDPNSGGVFEMNAFALASNGGYLYVASIGGVQGQDKPNSHSALQRIAVNFPDNAPALTILTPGQLPAGVYEFRDISFDDDGNAYLFTGTYNSNWNMNWTLYKSADITVLLELEEFDSATDVAGYYWSAQYAADNNRLWFVRGNDIWVYDADDAESAGILTMSDLIGSSTIPYDSLNDLAYIGVPTAPPGRRALRGYKSHWQRSNSDLARAVRAITRGRPEATEEEVAQARASLAK
jgi:hypothetical protein